MIAKDITLEEVLKIVTFDRANDGTLRVVDINGSLQGDVLGSVYGRVKGSVWGKIEGNYWGETEPV